MDTSNVQNSTIGSLAFTDQSQISQNTTIQSDFGPSTTVTEGPDNSTTEDNQPPSYTWNNLSSDIYIEPYRPRNANNWIHLGRFETEADMHKMRCKERVSKRRTEQLKNGTKVRYRCNKWKRTKCAFQMYAWFSNGKIDLYESGTHDHSGQKMALHKLRMQSKGLLPPGTKLPQPPPQPILSQEDILNNLLKQATSQHGNQEIVTVHASVGNNHGGEATSGMDTRDDEPAKKNMKYEEDNPTTQLLNAANAQYGFQQKESEKRAQSDQLSGQVNCDAGNLAAEGKAKHSQSDVQKSPLGQFTLADNFLKQHLTLVAHELDLQMTFLSPPGSTAECLIRSKNPLFSKRAILLKEESDGKSLLVCDLHKDKVAHEERWIKGDQPQFVWAVRGKCSHRLWMQLSIQKSRYSNSRTAQNHIEIGPVNAFNDQSERLDNKKALERMNQITGSGFYESMTLKKFVNMCGQTPKSYDIGLDTVMSPLESNDQK
ncbi:hypothetical protein DdX_08283 [Ditylenchus destructor]|uniref:Uncharacterized protein n=1 Tax=Ditylenchus destructor TaxID=166010 RepID=A0AAD4N2U5_9BILA|nr:hypothetical protein DdX_08283 [Ditylenchus destructor]